MVSNNAPAISTLTVKNIQGFLKNQVLLIGEPGNGGAEIKKTHASTQPVGSTITLTANTSFPHSAGTYVYKVDWDQIEISNAATLTGSKTVLVTTSLAPALAETLYIDTGANTGFYFARFKNTITSEFSPYSDGVPVAGYGPTTARSVIDNALGSINKKSSDILSDDFAFNELNNFQWEVLRTLKRWSWMQKFDQIVTQAAIGYWRVAAPTDLDDQETNRSVYKFRLGRESEMVWVDKEKFDELIGNTAYTTLAAPITVAGSTATLTNSNDFDDSGTIQVGQSDYSYTANNRLTGVLTLSGTIATAYAIGLYVFQGASRGNPKYWTSYDGFMYHWPVVAETYRSRNYYLDYYASLTAITTDSDTLAVPDPVMAQSYLSWKLLRKINNGEETQASLAFYQQFEKRLAVLKNKETMNRTFKFRPRFNNFSVQSRSNVGDDRETRLGNYEDA